MTTTNQEPTMTTPTPPAWMTCDHRGIGLPGCPTCDGRLDPEARRLLLEAAQYAGGLLAAHVSAGAALKEALCIIEQHRDADAHGAYGIGPWTRVGGNLPEPWPGMGVKVSDRNGWAMYLCEPVCVDGVVYATIVGEAEMPKPAATWRLDEVAEVWDGRVCVWRREA